MERGHQILTLNKRDLPFWAPNRCAKYQNRIKIAAIGVHTDKKADKRK